MEGIDRTRIQATLVRTWLESAEALRVADSVVARLRLDCEGRDLVHQAWVRVTTSFATRSEPLPDLNESADAARYGNRVISNIGLDRLRALGRSPVTALDHVEVAPVDERHGPEGDSLVLLFFEELLRRVSVSRSRESNCGGCSADVVRSIAITVVQTFALEVTASALPADVDGRERFERLVNEAIESGGEVGESARMRKRRSRCRACVRDLIAGALEEMEERHD